MPSKKKPPVNDSVYVDPKKLRSPTSKPLTKQDLREGRVPLNIVAHPGRSPHAVDRAGPAKRKGKGGKS